MKTIKVIKIGKLAIVLVAFLCTLLMPGALIGGNIPSVEDVVKGKASMPTIEDLTGGKVKSDDLIDKSNVELVKDYLTVSAYELVKRGMVLKIGRQLPPDQLNPKSFRDITESNRGKAVVDDNGVVYYNKIGTKWSGGVPFPWAKSGLEAMGNFFYARIWDTYQNSPVDMWYVNSKGQVYKNVGQEHMYVKCNSRTQLPPLGTIPGYEDIYTKRISVTTYPLEIKGLGQYTVRYYDPSKKYDTGFAYLPAFKRTIRINANTWQDNIAGSDLTYGDGDGFQEPFSDWNFKLIGKKFLLVHEPKNPFPMHDKNGKLSSSIQFDVGKKFPRLGYVIWPIDVVEATPKIKHVYGKKVLYIAIWPYLYSGVGIVAADIYDRQMKLWKGQTTYFGCQTYLNGDPQNAITPFSGGSYYDLQEDHTTHMWVRQLINTPLKPEDLNLGRLLKFGR